MNVAVTGGAGYIGSHAVMELRKNGHEVLVLDNLSSGHAAAVEGVPLHTVDLSDFPALTQALDHCRADAVMHFAASINVGESVDDPEKYYHNNLVNTLTLLSAMRRCAVKHLVFSGSCAVYGIPDRVPITEDCPFHPISPYGKTKAMVEAILADYATAYGLKYASLRYFNASGAMPGGSIGEDHDPETHLIPLVIQAAMGQRDGITVYGDDYPTPDGTCVRDYVHVLDLASAHVKALEALGKKAPLIYNLGAGRGYSVREVIETVREVSGREVPVRMGARRPGDPPALVNDPQKVMDELQWEPQFTDLNHIVRTAWQWHSRHPEGFRS